MRRRKKRPSRRSRIDVARLGRPVSHGCVRLAPANAATLYALVAREGAAKTTIEIQ